jgi:hypothetical protein
MRPVRLKGGSNVVHAATRCAMIGHIQLREVWQCGMYVCRMHAARRGMAMWLRHQQKGTLLAMSYRISTLQMPYHIKSEYIKDD